MSPSFPKLSVRRATQADAETIAGIAASVDFHDDLRLGRGFIVYTLPAADYARRILRGYLAYMFLMNGHPIGYICGCDHVRLARDLADETLAHQSNVCRTIMAQARDRVDKQYLFLEQIAILPEFQDKGFGEAFFGKFCDLHPGPFYVSMLEGPVRNPRIAYWEARGFQCVGVAREVLPFRFVTSPVGGNLPCELRWGVYVLPTNGYRSVQTSDHSVTGPSDK
jgi:GNAT superfamily N-acetyltransferase